VHLGLVLFVPQRGENARGDMSRDGDWLELVPLPILCLSKSAHPAEGKYRGLTVAESLGYYLAVSPSCLVYCYYRTANVTLRLVNPLVQGSTAGDTLQTESCVPLRMYVTCLLFPAVNPWCTSSLLQGGAAAGHAAEGALCASG
jgi:hypothetical protein